MKLFIPYVVYMCLVLLYCCYHVTNPGHDDGFFRGKGTWITVRIFIVVLAVFYIIVSFVRVYKSPTILRSFAIVAQLLGSLELNILNLWIVIESCQENPQVSKLRLV